MLPDWAGLALSGATVAVYMGRSVAARVAARLIEAGLAATTPVAVIENATLPERRLFAGELRDLRRFAERDRGRRPDADPDRRRRPRKARSPRPSRSLAARIMAA